MVFVALLVLWWVRSRMRDMVHGVVPFGQTLSTLSMMLLAFIPAAREALVSWVVPNGWWDWRKWLAMKDPFGYDLPIGFIAVAVSAALAVSTVLLGANISMRHFATPPEPDCEVEFTIGSDGRRIDVLPPRPWSQHVLGYAIWLTGIGLLLSCTHQDCVSLSVAAFALAQRTLVHVVRQWWIALTAVRPDDFRPLMSAGWFEEQGRQNTARAVAHLREYVRENAPKVMERCSTEGSELRLRRFSDGGQHFQPPPEAIGLESRRWCVVM